MFVGDLLGPQWLRPCALELSHDPHEQSIKDASKPPQLRSELLIHYILWYSATVPAVYVSLFSEQLHSTASQSWVNQCSSSPVHTGGQADRMGCPCLLTSLAANVAYLRLCATTDVLVVYQLVLVAVVERLQKPRTGHQDLVTEGKVMSRAAPRSRRGGDT
jgi:hypothetical protein